MTTLREAAQMALEALETKGEHHPRVYRAIEALRTALADEHKYECYEGDIDWHEAGRIAYAVRQLMSDTEGKETK